MNQIIRQPAVYLAGLTLLLAGCKPPGGGASGGSTGSSVATAAKTNDLDATPSKTAPTTVQVIPARQGQLTTKRRVSATISAGRDSNVAAASGGTVARVNVTEGDRVVAGQVLAQLDTTSLQQSVESARLSLQNAQINLQQAQRNTGLSGNQLQQAVLAAQSNLAKAQATYTANQQVYALGGISAADLQASQANLAQAQADLASARNNLAQNGQSGSGSLALLQNQVASAQNALAQAQENLSKASVRAPFAGTVASVSAKVGEFLAAGASAARLVDPSTLQADFKVAPGDAASLKAGTPVNVTYQAVNSVGRIASANAVAGSDRLVPLKARITQASIPVGAIAQVSYNVTLGGGVLLPSGAVLTDADTTSAFVVKGERAVQLPVTILAEAGGQVAVRGLTAGQQVVNPIPSGLQDGVAVQVSKVGGTGP